MRQAFLILEAKLEVTPMIQCRPVLSALALIAFVFIAGPVHAAQQPFEGGVSRWIQLFGQGVGKYYGLYTQVKEKFDGFTREIDLGSNVIAGAPLAVDPKMIDWLNSQADQFAALSQRLTMPKFDPMKGVLETDLGSADPRVRTAAYDAIEANHVEYERLVERYEQKASQASGILNRAEGDYQRLRKYDEMLAEINRSPIANKLNAVTGNKFAYLWLDANTTLFDAITRRAGAAHDLKNAYDRTVSGMKKQLEQAKDLRDWARFFGSVSTRKAPGQDSASKAISYLDRAENNLRDARAKEAAGRGLGARSETAIRLETILNSSHVLTQTVRSEVADLLQKADAADRIAANQSMVTKVLGLASAAANFASAQTDSSAPANPGSVQTNTPTIIYYDIKVVPPWDPGNGVPIKPNK